MTTTAASSRPYRAFVNNSLKGWRHGHKSSSTKPRRRFSTTLRLPSPPTPPISGPWRPGEGQGYPYAVFSEALVRNRQLRGSALSSPQPGPNKGAAGLLEQKPVEFSPMARTHAPACPKTQRDKDTHKDTHTHKHTHRQRERDRERQTNRPTDGRADGPTDRHQTDGRKDGHTNRRTDTLCGDHGKLTTLSFPAEDRPRPCACPVDWPGGPRPEPGRFQALSALRSAGQIAA